jgi:hypothetical protein
VQQAIREANGLERAADLIEQAVICGWRLGAQ